MSTTARVLPFVTPRAVEPASAEWHHALDREIAARDQARERERHARRLCAEIECDLRLERAAFIAGDDDDA
jgi:hypothetical protein